MMKRTPPTLRGQIVHNSKEPANCSSRMLKLGHSQQRVMAQAVLHDDHERRDTTARDPNAFSGPPTHFASGPQTVPQNVGARRIVLHHAGRLRSSAHADAEAHYRPLLSGSPAYVQGEPLNSSDGVLNGIHDTTARARLS